MSESDLKDIRTGQHVAVRLDEAIQNRMDALTPHISQPWHTATRSDTLRALIRLALDVAEKEPERLRMHAMHTS
jgi:hypothetical protein